MIYFNGLLSIFESLYLKDFNITDKLIKADIVVNPTSHSYMSGKTVILNIPGVNQNILEHLLTNGNKVISRIPGYKGNIEFIPYLEQPIFEIMWNGKTIQDIDCNNIDNLEDYEVDYPNLYFPKAINYKDTVVDGYPSALGYLLFQVGQDGVIENNIYNNLDIIKCKKGIL